MKKINQNRLFIINNALIFTLTATFVPITLIFGSVASQKDGGPFAYWQHIVTFTILSNIFLGIIALIAACLLIASSHGSCSNVSMPSISAEYT